ncbi:division/cell wall cluster transcriptional repressor MraZ [Candidatus Woesearchaeota archaeon]|nr:division/cell wall cluster transcriptional repressor MraZ [Candidatus Woesearchaeota archaeon]
MASYVSTFHRKIAGNKLVLPSLIAKELEERNKGYDTLTAVETSDLGFECIALYDNNAELPSTDEPSQILSLENKTLYLTKELKRFLDIRKDVVVTGVDDSILLWNPDIYKEWNKISETKEYKQTMKKILQV